MVVAESMGMVMIMIVVVIVIVVVGMRMFVGVCHGTVLSVVVAGGGKGVDDPAIGHGDGGVWDEGWDDVDGAAGEQVFCSADHHLHFAFRYVGDLFVDMGVFGQDAAFFYVPKYQGAAFAVDHFPEKAWSELFDWDVPEVLHAMSLAEGTSK
jgi:hypothetical protein